MTKKKVSKKTKESPFTTIEILKSDRQKLMDLAMESEYDIRRQGSLMVAKMALGHGILRPESAISIKTG